VSKYDDVSITIDEQEADLGFAITAYFPNITPITERTSEEDAKKLHNNLSSSISTRLVAFTRLLDEVARKGTSLQPWQEIDGAITTLAVLLHQGGLDGALECIRPADEGVKSLEGRDDSNNPEIVSI